MRRLVLPIAAMAAFTLPAAAESHLSENAALGEKAFKACQSCHVVKDDDGNVLAGRNAKAGPNLYGIFGLPAAGKEAFGRKYSKSLRAAAEAGLVWDTETLTAWLVSPNDFLKEYLDDPKARSRMSYKGRPDKRNGLSKEEVAANIAIFLAEIGPAPMAETEDADANADPGSDADTDGEAGSGTDGS